MIKPQTWMRATGEGMDVLPNELREDAAWTATLKGYGIPWPEAAKIVTEYRWRHSDICRYCKEALDGISTDEDWGDNARPTA